MHCGCTGNLLKHPTGLALDLKSLKGAFAEGKKRRVTRLEYRTVGMVHTDTRTCRRRFNEEYVLKTIGFVFVTEASFVVYCFHVHCSPARRYRRIRGQGEWCIWRENWKNVKSWKAHVVRTHVMRKYESFDGRLLIGAACVSHISK
jgi:hypothetical protein